MLKIKIIPKTEIESKWKSGLRTKIILEIDLSLIVTEMSVSWVEDKIWLQRYYGYGYGYYIIILCYQNTFASPY